MALSISHHEAHASEMTCTPKNIGPGDRVIVDFGDATHTEMAVITPDRTFFYVNTFRMNPNISHPPMIGREIFQKISGLVIDPEKFIASKWVKPGGYERVFVESGSYTVRVGETLSSHDSVIAECTINYRAD